MDKPEAVVAVDEQALSYWDQHRFLLLIVFTVVIALVLVGVSLLIYRLSGAAQLDLSRPGYQSVSNQVDKTTDMQDYSAFGELSSETVKEFTDIYDLQAAKAKAIDAFNGDPLNPEVLEFGDDANE